MKTRKFSKQIIATVVVAIIILMTNAGVVNATLQANPNTQYTLTDVASDWMKEFRKMEESGGGMGLSETLKEDLTGTPDSNGNGNGIDIHMMRSTEYGAIAILSASGYGNSSNEQAITTTTGNNTGMILNTANWEFVAGGVSGSIFSGINSRYFDTYTASDKTSARIGDALGDATSTNPGCAGWHSASSSYWVDGNEPYFRRGNGGIFSFHIDHAIDSNYARGVAVCGAGL